MTRIIVNGREVDADPKQPLIAACNLQGADVPHYCYHPGLTPVGSCRICQVEVQQGSMPARVVVACRTPVVEGMVVNTEAPKAHDARRECLEFLLKNHPLDCPICDKAGECTLQDYSFQERQGEGRSAEPRRKLEKRHSLGDVIVLDQERCILCSRCVRFFEEIPKQAQLTVADLGSRSVISTFGDRPLTGNYQGNIADLCPVGALTLKNFRFQARVWNLRKAPSTCRECSRGCSITVETLRNHQVKRIRPRENALVNQWWMCDTGRFAIEHFNEPRLVGALVRGERGLESASSEAAAQRAADLFRSNAPRLVLASPFCTQEEGRALLALARGLQAEALFLSPPANDLKDNLLHTGDPCPNRRGLSELGFQGVTPEQAGARLAQSSSALVFGERAAELLGEQRLGALPAQLRLVLCDVRGSQAEAVKIAIGLANSVEKSGHWINLDGHSGLVSPARPAPVGCADPVRLLASLDKWLAQAALQASTR